MHEAWYLGAEQQPAMDRMPCPWQTPEWTSVLGAISGEYGEPADDAACMGQPEVQLPPGVGCCSSSECDLRNEERTSPA
eukprot:scaffold263057_cov32-Tisochrysis_lutea.AAC.3